MCAGRAQPPQWLSGTSFRVTETPICRHLIATITAEVVLWRLSSAHQTLKGMLTTRAQNHLSNLTITIWSDTLVEKLQYAHSTTPHTPSFSMVLDLTFLWAHKETNMESPPSFEAAHFLCTSPGWFWYCNPTISLPSLYCYKKVFRAHAKCEFVFAKKGEHPSHPFL